jgi:hypothetical protein
MPEGEIISFRRNHSGEDTLSRTQDYSWIYEVRWEKTDLGRISSLGREPDEDIALLIAEKFDSDPRLSA